MWVAAADEVSEYCGHCEKVEIEGYGFVLRETEDYGVNITVGKG